MSLEHPREEDAPIQRALRELQALIRQRYPSAEFAVERGEDPEGIYLRAMVDVEDTDDVVEVFRDRLLELQVEERLPVYVIPVEPIERAVEQLRVRARTSARTPRTSILDLRTAPTP